MNKTFDFLQSAALSIAGFAFLSAPASSLAAEDFTLGESDYHLRNVEPREWAHYPENPDATRLEIPFDIGDDAADYRTLILHQAGVRQAWVVKLNGKKLGQLERDHNRLQSALKIPTGLLKPAGNHLEIASNSKNPDDIHVGGLILHDETPEKMVAGARIQISVSDQDSGDPLPCRLTIVDAKSRALALLDAKSDDRLAVRSGAIYTLDGQADFGLRPGSYHIWAGRGFEYSLTTVKVEIAAGARRKIALKLRREVPTPGLVASDTHLHTGEFAGHGNATLIERLITLAGEGIELPISTEHEKHIDYSPEAKRIGAAKFFTPVIGCEVTTSEGHFNSFPIVAGSEPAQHRLRKWPQVFENIYATPGVKFVVLNHARDVHRGFRPFGPENFDAGKGNFIDGRKLAVNGLELINSGAQQSDPMRLVHDWFALLKSGHKIAGVGSSDSHTVNYVIAGQARTYVPCPDGDPSKLDVAAAVEGFVAGETHVSFGLLVQLELNGGIANARVLGPSWTQAEKLTLYANGVAVETLEIAEADATRPGLKFEHTWPLANFSGKTFLVAVAEGPGITEPFWPMMPPYQASSPEFKPFVMGISPVRWVERK